MFNLSGLEAQLGLEQLHLLDVNCQLGLGQIWFDRLDKPQCRSVLTPFGPDARDRQCGFDPRNGEVGCRPAVKVEATHPCD
ncbi:MAG TPA: hypothetical protein VF488_13130, partial [Gemmatimonadaceae bacterium]